VSSDSDSGSDSDDSDDDDDAHDAAAAQARSSAAKPLWLRPAEERGEDMWEALGVEATLRQQRADEEAKHAEARANRRATRKNRPSRQARQPAAVAAAPAVDSAEAEATRQAARRRKADAQAAAATPSIVETVAPVSEDKLRRTQKNRAAEVTAKRRISIGGIVSVERGTLRRGAQWAVLAAAMLGMLWLLVAEALDRAT
jgi:hypothetical protein